MWHVGCARTGTSQVRRTATGAQVRAAVERGGRGRESEGLEVPRAWKRRPSFTELIACSVAESPGERVREP